MTIPAPVPSSQSLVRLEAVRKSFGDNLVLDGIDLDVETGEVLTIIGPAGVASRPRCAA